MFKFECEKCTSRRAEKSSGLPTLGFSGLPFPDTVYFIAFGFVIEIEMTALTSSLIEDYRRALRKDIFDIEQFKTLTVN